MLMPSAVQSRESLRCARSIRAENDIRQRIRLALKNASPRPEVVERRKEQRHPFPYLVHLTPVTEAGNPKTEETIVVVGRHLSELGFDFYHREPIPHRKVIASFGVGINRRVSVVLDLAWCRFNEPGWYCQGGRFLNIANTPVGEDQIEYDEKAFFFFEKD